MKPHPFRIQNRARHLTSFLYRHTRLYEHATSLEQSVQLIYKVDFEMFFYQTLSILLGLAFFYADTHIDPIFMSTFEKIYQYISRLTRLS